MATAKKTDPAVKEAEIVTFLKDGFRDYAITIPETDRELALAAGESSIQFTRISEIGKPHVCAHATAEPKVIAFLRRLTKQGIVTLREDLRGISLKCPYCEYRTDGNNPGDQVALSQHIVTHIGDDGEIQPVADSAAEAGA